MERAIKDLCQLEVSALAEQAATGIHYVLEVVDRLEPAARQLAGSDRHHASRILYSLAAEEAAKALILIDALRCPADRHSDKSRTLGYFYDHVAKGIYVEACRWRPIDFGEVVRYVELQRTEYYLDGPNGVDWIIPNDIKQSREDDLYVGYVRYDSENADQAESTWILPRDDNDLLYSAPSVVELVRALRDVGATTASGLSVVSDVWGTVNVEPHMRIDALEQLNLRTLAGLEERGLLVSTEVQSRATVQSRWLFPLWSIDLRTKKVAKKELREFHRRGYPDI